jgi:hypothetical protein
MALEILPKGLGRHACTHAGGRGVQRQKLNQSWRTSVHIKKIGRNYAPAYGQQVCNNFTECEGGPLAYARGSERCSVFRMTMALRPTQNKEDAEFIALARQQGERDGPVAWNQLFGHRLQRTVKAFVPTDLGK